MPRVWRHRHPRLSAGLLVLKGGTAVAAVYTVLATLILSKNPIPTTVLLLKSAVLFEAIAVLAAALAMILFAETVRRSATGSIVAGVVCVVISNPLPFVASEFYPASRSYFWIDGDVAGRNPLDVAIWWDLSVVFFTHIATLFAPEIVGGLCGHAIWRSCRTPNA